MYPSKKNSFMKKNTINFKNWIGLLLIVLGVLTSCKKLDEVPQSFVTPDKFYSTPAQVEATFAAAMNRLWDYWGGYGYGMGNFINDDQYYGGDLVISNNHASDLWNAHYAAIGNLNSAIAAMKKGSLGANTSQDVIDN